MHWVPWHVQLFWNFVSAKSGLMGGFIRHSQDLHSSSPNHSLRGSKAFGVKKSVLCLSETSTQHENVVNLNLSSLGS